MICNVPLTLQSAECQRYKSVSLFACARRAMLRTQPAEYSCSVASWEPMKRMRGCGRGESTGFNGFYKTTTMLIMLMLILIQIIVIAMAWVVCDRCWMRVTAGNLKVVS